MKRPRTIRYAAGALAGALIAATVTLSPADAAGSGQIFMQVTAPPAIAPGGSAHVTGTLGVTLAQAETVSVTRVTRAGSTPLAAVPVATDGTFAFDDTPGIGGTATYTVSYAGDTVFAAGTKAGKTYVRGVPYDFNGDGYADGAVGSDGEAIGTLTNAGTFYTFPGTPNGITGVGSVAYTQDSTNVPGVVEKGDLFGLSQVSGDFNQDGYYDLAVSSPDEGVGSTPDAGSVTVFFGSAAGLTATGSFLVTGLAGDSNGFYGQAMAVGDFDGDGRDDLAVGAPGGDSFIFIYTNVSKTGVLDSNRTKTIQRNAVAGEDNDTNTLFGFALGAGDVNADGYTDLAVGSPYDYSDRGYSTGAVYVLYGGANGLNGPGAPGAQRWSLDSAGIKGVPATFGTDLSDEFGAQVVLGDFDGDGRADLASAAPGAPVTNASGKHEDAGTVSILFSRGGLISDSDLYLTEDTAGIVGSPGKNDTFGSTLAVGDENNDGKADLALFADNHYVQVIPGGGSTGLDTGHTVAWTQDSTGVPGSDEPGDEWGASLRFESFQGLGVPQDLLIGAPGENGDEGAITVLYNSGTGLTGTGSTAFSQSSTGVPGTAEPGDFMGTFF